jgi:hypothetical protein
MLRRDYILRMIEDFMQVLSRIKSLKAGQLWREAAGVVDGEFRQLLNSDARTVSRMSETELLAKIVQSGPTQAVREKTLMVATLLREAGDVAAGEERAEDSRACYLKGLNLLLDVLGTEEVFEYPEFVPKVDLFVARLSDFSLPPQTQLRLMQHYERMGEFGRAEDMLFSMLNENGANPGLVEFGMAFYRRLAGQSDAALADGNLPRAELEAGLAELKGGKGPNG